MYEHCLSLLVSVITGDRYLLRSTFIDNAWRYMIVCSGVYLCPGGVVTWCVVVSISMV